MWLPFVLKKHTHWFRVRNHNLTKLDSTGLIAEHDAKSERYATMLYSDVVLVKSVDDVYVIKTRKSN